MSDKQHIDDQQEPTSLVVRIIRGVVAFVAIVGMVWLFGLGDYFRFQRTSPSVEQEIPAAIDAELVSLPLRIIVIRADQGGSGRSLADINRLVENADRVWQQAQIELRVVAVEEREVLASELSVFYDNPNRFITSQQSYDPQTISVYLIETIGGGINGLSYGDIRAVSVADYTSVFDFRVLAHEIGHQLGLGHVPSDQGRLMYRGANGFELSEDEIARARMVVQQKY